MRRRTTRVLLVVVVCGLVACYRRGMTVTVANESAAAVMDVALHYEKGQAEAVASLGTIQPGKAANVHIVFNAESYLVIRFRGTDGSQHKEKIDVYLENSHAPIKLRIMRDYGVVCGGC
jgi:hypothetical protein